MGNGTRETHGAPLLDAGVKDLQTVDHDDSPVRMFERLAVDPNASVEKIERLMALWERGEARKAESLFNAAMAEAQKEMRPVAADSFNPQTKSKYASYEALDQALRPIYTKHGFGLSFDTGEGAPAEFVRVLCYVTHLAGHARTYRLDMPADGKGAKGGDVMTKTHATGSALSYGTRYLLKMIFNIAVGDQDDDGNQAAGRGAKPEPPDGYEKWALHLETTAVKGVQAFDAAWNTSDGDPDLAKFKTYMVNHDRDRLKAIKAVAAGKRS